MPKISICIPVYNTAHFLERCLNSILNQEFEDIEIIIVNDASPDNSIDIIRKYSDFDNRFVVINKQENEGLMCARRDAYAVAKGDYIMFVDSDDYLEPNALSILYDVINNTAADIVVSGYNYYPICGSVSSMVYQLPYGNTRDGVIKALLTRKLPHNLWANLYRRDLFDKYSYTCFKHQTNGEDMILFYELVNNSYKIVTANKALYAYCQNLESSTQRKLTDDKLKKWIDLKMYWYNYMLHECGFKRLIKIYLMRTLLSIFMQGYDISLIKEHTKAIKEEFTLSKACARLGIVKGLVLITLYNGWLSPYLMQKIKHMIKK